MHFVSFFNYFTPFFAFFIFKKEYSMKHIKGLQYVYGNIGERNACPYKRLKAISIELLYRFLSSNDASFYNCYIEKSEAKATYFSESSQSKYRISFAKSVFALSSQSVSAASLQIRENLGYLPAYCSDV